MKSPWIVVISRESDRAVHPTAITAAEYLEGKGSAFDPNTRVLNFCRSYRYLSRGYYVSMIAEARGQLVLPTVETLERMGRSRDLIHRIQELGLDTVEGLSLADRRGGVPSALVIDGELDPTHVQAMGKPQPRSKIQFEHLRDAEAVRFYSILGRSSDRRFHRIAAAIHREWPLPICEIRLIRYQEKWCLAGVRPGSLGDLGEDAGIRVRTAVDETSIPRQPKPAPVRASIAVLFDPDDPWAPSDARTIDQFRRIAKNRSIHVQKIGLKDMERIGDFDGLWIRTLTSVGSKSFSFAMRAQTLGIPVIDDPLSIIRCSNKVYLHEILSRNGLATPPTRIVHPTTKFKDLESSLGLPFVLKLPDGSFSNAVHKVESQESHKKIVQNLMSTSPLLVAQAFTPSDFDWRIGVLGGRILYTCKYFMVRGHWQIRDPRHRVTRYGKVECVPRDRAPADVVKLALSACDLIGKGIYGVDIKPTPIGPIIIEINDNPSFEMGSEDQADGDRIFHDILDFFLAQIPNSGSLSLEAPKSSEGDSAGTRSHVLSALDLLRQPVEDSDPRRLDRPYEAYEVCGLELEYPIVDRDLSPVPLVEGLLDALAGRPTSNVTLGILGLSNEIVDHVIEIKTDIPLTSFLRLEDVLVDGVRRASTWLKDQHGARLLPTGMHPWFDPRESRIWQRSGRRIYDTYEKLFDLKSHGWANVQASHVNLPLGPPHEATAMMNAAALLVPYLPALAASSPMYGGRLRTPVDNRLHFILTHQSRIPESCGQIVPELITDLTDYRRRVIKPMYEAVDRLEGAEALRAEFFNARGAVFKFSRKSMEVRILDVQECVKMDIAIACFVRGALRVLSDQLIEESLALPDHEVLVEDLHRVVDKGSAAMVRCPHALAATPRDARKRIPVRQFLKNLLAEVRNVTPIEEYPYLDRVGWILETGNLSERLRRVLEPHKDDPNRLARVARRVYGELADALIRNEPWSEY